MEIYNLKKGIEIEGQKYANDLEVTSVRWSLKLGY